MIRIFAVLTSAILLFGCAAPQGPANQLERANVLPLALDNSFQFRKVQQTFFDHRIPMPNTQSDAARFERSYLTWGAINSWDLEQRDGNYYNFFWRTSTPADVTVRLEYRQAGLGNYVKAKELYYPNARGSYKSHFEVVGDEFHENGRVTAWRALLIVDGRIVALRQSFMWR